MNKAPGCTVKVHSQWSTAAMKQRFLNQKLGKRMSRKMELQKAKALASRSNVSRRTTKVSQGLAGEKVS